MTALRRAPVWFLLALVALAGCGPEKRDPSPPVSAGPYMWPCLPINWRTALDSPIYRTYALLVGSALLAGALGLLIARFLCKREVSKIWITYRSWLVMAPLAFLMIGLGREVTIVLLTLLSVLGVKEFARATGLYRDWWMTGAVYLAIVATGVATLIGDPTYTGLHGWWGLFLAMPAFAITLFVLIPILRDRATGQLQYIALTILAFLYLGWMFGHLPWLANTNHAYGYLLYLMFAVEVNDIAAFTFGKLFGRHKLRPTISPNKTWEGALGALAVSMALPWLLRFSFPHFTPTELILTGLIVGVGGQLGDLSISLIKRDIGVKDMGALIPGHGGVLDRIDSLLYTAPLFLHMIQNGHGIYSP